MTKEKKIEKKVEKIKKEPVPTTDVKIKEMFELCCKLIYSYEIDDLEFNFCADTIQNTITFLRRTRDII